MSGRGEGPTLLKRSDLVFFPERTEIKSGSEYVTHTDV